MSELLNGSLSWRPAVVIAAFGLLAFFEVARPWRTPPAGSRGRWLHHLALAALNTAVVRLLLPLGLTGVAAWCAQHSIGLSHHLDMAVWLESLVAIVLLDMAIYWQHRLFHLWPPLWRIHRAHHADPVFDVTTGVRFHPAEIALSLVFKLAVVVLLGASPMVVLVFELMLTVLSLFTHSNIFIAPALDHVLRWLIVTPDMHRVHHSIVRNETNSNFGFQLSIWDRLFGSYRGARGDEARRLVFGIEEFGRRQDVAGIGDILRIPLLNVNDRPPRER